jgi:hypothetical protein
MLKIFFYLILILLLYSFNAGFLPGFELFSALPNLLLILVLYFALETEGEFYLPLAFVSGLVLDLSTGVFLGSFSVAFLLISAGLRAFSRDVAVIHSNWKYFPFILLVSQCILYAWLYGYNRMADYIGAFSNLLNFRLLVTRFVWEFVYNLLFIYPVWQLAYAAQKLAAKFSFRK